MGTRGTKEEVRAVKSSKPATLLMAGIRGSLFVDVGDGSYLLAAVFYDNGNYSMLIRRRGR